MRTPDSWNSQLGLHRQYLDDEPRNRAFRVAIEKLVKPGMRVLDLGSGTGIWACVAARAGASKVVAIEFSDMAAHARRTVELNNLTDVVEVIQADIRAVSLDRDFDVIVHELIGGLVWEEDMVELTAIARDRFLRPGGALVPDIVRVFFAPWSMRDRPWPGDWKTVAGIDLTHMFDADMALWHENRRATVTQQFQDYALAKPGLVHTIRLGHDREPVPKHLAIDFVADRDGRATGLLGFMEIGLHDEWIRTSPWDPPTNWGQFYIPAAEPLVMKVGETIHVEVTPQSRPEGWDVKWHSAPRAYAQGDD